MIPLKHVIRNTDVLFTMKYTSFKKFINLEAYLLYVDTNVSNHLSYF